MNGKNLKILSIFLVLIFSFVSCKKESSLQRPGTVSQSNNGGYNYSNGNLSWSNSGGWNWSASGGWVSTGGENESTKPPAYVYPPGQNDPALNSDCYSSGISTGGGGSLPYYKIQAIGHGNPGGLAWSSTSLPSDDQQIFTTDSRFNIRIVAKASPPKGTKDYKGVTCNYEGLAFTKIKLTVGLRKPNSNYYTAQYDISGIPVGKCSNVLEFTDYQIPVTDGPIVLDIINFQHDYYCKMYENGPYAGNPQFCPFVALPNQDCFSIEVQFATDYTLDIPH